MNLVKYRPLTTGLLDMEIDRLFDDLPDGNFCRDPRI